MHKVLISNIGFGKTSPSALSLLKENFVVVENKENKRFSEEDFLRCIENTSILIAGTEKVTDKIISKAKNLKLICRVGSGVDSVDLESARIHNVKICYTPDAPSSSVPEFTVALILNLIKGISSSDRCMHEKKWHRPMGRSLNSCRLGIIGAGKIGSKVAKLILALESRVDVFFYDPYIDSIDGAKKLPLDEVFINSDIVSVHVPLCESTRHLVSKWQLDLMPVGSYLINTSRGGIVDEDALHAALSSGHLAGAALDVFENEPYSGNLCDLENCVLTSHIGSMNREVRAIMEEQIVDDIINFINNKPLLREFKYKEPSYED